MIGLGDYEGTGYIIEDEEGYLGQEGVLDAEDKEDLQAMIQMQCEEADDVLAALSGTSKPEFDVLEIGVKQSGGLQDASSSRGRTFVFLDSVRADVSSRRLFRS